MRRVILIHAFICMGASAASLRHSDASEEPRHLNGLAEAFITDIKGVVKTETYRDPADEQEVADDPLAMLLKPRIVGQSIVAPGAYPFFCRIDNNFYPSCSGSLVAPDVVLTSADCMPEDENARDLTVLVNGEGRPSTRFRKVVTMVAHPKFSNESFHNDLMLLKLNEPVEGVPLVELNRDSSKPALDDEVTVTGLGAIFGGRGYPDVIQSVEVDMIGNGFCSAAYKDIGLSAVDDDIMFCAGQRPEGTENACQISSGSPVLDENNVQIGVISYGLGCRSRQEFPEVYARTAVRNGDDWLGQTLCMMTDTMALAQWCSQTIKEFKSPETPVGLVQSRTFDTMNLPKPMSSETTTVNAAPIRAEESESSESESKPVDKECEDSDEPIKFKKQFRTCAWLAARPAKWKRVACQKGQDAYAKCHKTCNSGC